MFPKGNILNISAIQESDGGSYKCTADNGILKVAEAVVSINVLGKNVLSVRLFIVRIYNRLIVTMNLILQLLLIRNRFYFSSQMIQIKNTDHFASNVESQTKALPY